jgi:DNA gyrase/topoisomerase IV subunit A
VGCVGVLDDEEIMCITSQGKSIKLKVEAVSVMGRAARGVKILSINRPDFVIGVDRIVREEEEVPAGTRSGGTVMQSDEEDTQSDGADARFGGDDTLFGEADTQPGETAVQPDEEDMRSGEEDARSDEADTLPDGEGTLFS